MTQIEMLPVTADIRKACSESPGRLTWLLGLHVPAHWPEFPQAFSPAFPNDEFWPGFLFVDPLLETIVGNGGYVGPPDASGAVEIGYEIASAYRNRGYATHAVHMLVDRAFRHAEVESIVAHTLPEKNASGAVLRKSGFRFTGVVTNGKSGIVWRWVRTARADSIVRIESPH